MAGSQGPTERLRDEVTCSICLDYFTDPVCIECGHNFCRACITRCWEGPGVAPLCPQCRGLCAGGALHPNLGLRNVVEVIRVSITPQAQLCPAHQERLQLFCETDLTPICVVCDRSHLHRWHNVLPVEEATAECKVIFNNRIKHLTKELEHLQKSYAEERSTTLDLERNFKIQTVKIIGIFEHLKQFLEKEKKQLLTRLEKEHEIYMKIIKDKMSALEKQHSTHRSLITELEGTCRMQDVELLKGAQSILYRCDDVKTVKPVEDVKLSTVLEIQYACIQDVLMELKKTLPAKLFIFIAQFQLPKITFECVKQKFDEACLALDKMNSQNARTKQVQERVESTSGC